MSVSNRVCNNEKGIGNAFLNGRDMGGRRLDAMLEIYAENYKPKEREKALDESKLLASQVNEVVRAKIGYNPIENLSFYVGYFTGKYTPFF